MQNSGVRLKWITLAAAVAIYAAMVLHLAPKSSPMDPDVWLHLVKAEQLHETGFSGSSVVARLDYPRGLDSHWSRPMDVYLLAGASLFQPEKNLKHALLEFSKWVNLLPFLAASLSLIWLAANLGISQNGQIFMLMFFVFSALSLSPFGPGLADHHGPAAALFLLMTALLSQGEASRRRLWYLLAGIAAGLGMWLAPDFFVPVSLALLWLAGLWVFGERPEGGEGAAFSGGAALAALPALYAEYGARLFVHFRYDKISFPHLVLLSLVFLAFVMLPRACPLKDRKSRLLASAPVVAIVLAVMALVFPGFWSGPMAEADPFISKYQLAFIHELQPALRLEWPMALLLVFNFLFALPVLFMAVRNKKEPLSTWALVFLSTSGLFILMLLHMRWYNYAIPASMAGIALFLDRLFYALRAKLSPITLKLKCDWLAPALILLALGP
ncbi:MAG: hypothetical protein GX410_05715, partial [Elusimicrobia bacterium]|nr:hypothetical protein [Elusimicrobiota bacterium]